MSKTELAWAAGFFDGEGWVGTDAVSKSGGMYLRVYVPQKFRRVLDRFQKAVGVGKVNGPHKHGPGRSFQFQCSASGDVKTIFTKLKPYLDQIKTRQFEDAIKCWNNRVTKTKRRI